MRPLNRLLLGMLLGSLATAGFGQTAREKLDEVAVRQQALLKDPADGRSMNALLALSRDSRWDVKSEAIMAIGRLGKASIPLPEDALVIVIGGLKSPDPFIRRSAAHAFLNWAPKEERAIEALLNAMIEWSGTDVAVFSAEALGEIRADPNRVIPALLAVAGKSRNRKPVFEASAAAKAISSFGATAAPYAKDLEMLIDYPDLDPEIQGRLLLPFARIAPESMVLEKAILALIGSRLGNIRFYGMQAIELLPSERYVGPIREAVQSVLQDPNPGVRFIAMKLEAKQREKGPTSR